MLPAGSITQYCVTCREWVKDVGLIQKLVRTASYNNYRYTVTVISIANSSTTQQHDTQKKRKHFKILKKCFFLEQVHIQSIQEET